MLYRFYSNHVKLLSNSISLNLINLFENVRFTHVSKMIQSEKMSSSHWNWLLHIGTSIHCIHMKSRLVINVLYLIMTVGAVKTAYIHKIFLQLALIAQMPANVCAWKKIYGFESLSIFHIFWRRFFYWCLAYLHFECYRISNS